MNFKLTFLRFGATIFALFCGLVAFAQVTTSTISGTVKAADGEVLPGARVEAVHVPSGSRYGAVSNSDGRYTLSNLRVGGPYTVFVSMQSFDGQKFEGISLSLGQKLALDASLTETSKSLGEVTVTGNADDVLNNERTGAQNNVNRQQLAQLPTISRSAFDYTRLSPQNDGFSFAGRNDQFNNFSLDGAIFNNPFGLDAATPGGQSDAQPISLDAIEQIQVSYAPYDVSQSGFTGAGVNAVTKSGTNTFAGTVYGFYRNQSMIGKKVDGVEAPRGDLTQFQTGFSIGGPLIKDKLFFFVNAESERRSDLGSAYLANRGTAGPGISRVLASDLEAVKAALATKGYDTGAYENFTFEAPNTKALLKLDWNISKAHKFAVTYNFLDASKQKPAHPVAIGRRGPDLTTLQFRNSGYQINNKLNQIMGELKSTFGDMVANKFQAGYSSFRDSRDPFSSPFPTINIAKDGVRYIVAGHEPFSVNNILRQDVIQINDKLDIYLGKHTLTVGAAFEKFSFDNCFNLGTIPGVFAPDFASTQVFVDYVAAGKLDADIASAKKTYADNAADDSKWNWAYMNLGQISGYIQDEYAINENLTVTAGIRLDKPTYFNTKDLIAEKIKPLTDPGCCYQPGIQYYDENGAGIKFDHTVLPTTKPLFSPRIGFNYDIKGDQTMQIRGGSGVFTGRLPFVWIGNQVANPNFFFYCVTHPDFQFPQVWRSNLGYDQKFGGGWVGSFDFIYTKDLNAMMVRNYALKAPSARLAAPGDTRPIYADADRSTDLFGGITNAYVFTNTDIGKSTNVTLQVKKEWKNGMFASLGYNFLDAKDASSIEAEISSDAYDRNPAYGNVNTAVESPSLYGNRHRVVGSFAKKFGYGGEMKDRFATTIGVFFQAAQGGRFSYSYSGDLNNDGSGNNDLIWIPTDAQIDQMNFSGDAAAQKSALKNYIAQDDYLSANRGAAMEKYGILSPWYSNLDLRILEDFNVKMGAKNRTFQLSLDVLNLGNLFSNSIGIRKIPVNTQPLGVSVDKATGVPTYSFDTNLKETFGQDFSLQSRWQAQVGLRFIF